MSTAAKLLSPF